MSVFTPSEPRLTLAEISKRLDIPKSTAHNLLTTLQSRGFIEKVEDDHYALGTSLVALTQAVRVNVELRDRAAPLLRELADDCRESVYLTILDGDYGLYIYAVESPRRLRARTAVGDRAHLHCTGVGKAILSCLPREAVEGIVSRVGLPKFTETTITELDTLQQELEQTRARGYALDVQEHEVGNYCVAAPILNERGRMIAACSAAGTDPEIIHGRLSDVSTHVMYTAQEISRRMGYVPAKLSSVVAVPSVNGSKR